MDYQAMFDNFAKAEELKRSQSGEFLNLWDLIRKLQSLRGDLKLEVPLGNLHSYRGYYSDLSIDPSNQDFKTVSDLLEALKEAVGKTYTGWKGGDFTMSKISPVWISEEWRGSQTRIVDVTEEDGLATIETRNAENDE